MNTQTQVKHTELPWRQGNGQYVGESIWTVDLETKRIAHGLSFEDNKFIITAVNNHYELVEALKVMYQQANKGRLATLLDLAQAKQALARAEVGQ